MLNELKSQQKELKRVIAEQKEKEVEKALNDFMNVVLNNDIPLEIKKTLLTGYKSTILDIFAD